MDLIVGAVGFIIGLFLWSSIWGSLFASIPIQSHLKKQGVIQKVQWTTIIGAIMFAVFVLLMSAIFLKAFFYGSLIAAVIMLFNVGHLRAEEFEKHTADHLK